MGEQAAALEAASRQLDKLSVRSRLASRDAKLPLRQLQAAAGQQGEALVALAQRMEKLEVDIRDTGARHLCFVLLPCLTSPPDFLWSVCGGGAASAAGPL